MKRLRPHEYEIARPLFAGMAEWNVYLTAVLNGDSPGRVYVDDTAVSRSGFAISLDCAYLVGDATNAVFNATLTEELNRTLWAGDRVNPVDPVLAVCLESDVWEAALADVMGAWRWPPIWGGNHYYVFGGSAPDWREKLPPGYTIARLDAHLLSQQGQNLPQTIADSIRIGWQDERNFLANGFGFVALSGEEIVCWCLADVVTGSACEIGIQTAVAHRRRGLATAVTAATVQFCQQQGFTHIGWHCGADNPGSIGTAVNAGFVLERPYGFYEFHYDEAHHFAELGRLYFFAGMAAEAAEALQISLELDDDPAPDVYLLAGRAWAKVGERETALDYLAAAVAAGFRDHVLLRGLPEFAPWRETQAWREIIDGS